MKKVSFRWLCDRADRLGWKLYRIQGKRRVFGGKGLPIVLVEVDDMSVDMRWVKVFGECASEILGTPFLDGTENSVPSKPTSENEEENLSAHTVATPNCGLDVPPKVTVIPFSQSVLADLQKNPELLHTLNPGQFELFIADRLSNMGFDTLRTGGVYRRDGGIDIIAIPRALRIFGCMVAVQCEHHRSGRATGRGKIRDLLEWRGNQFQLGVVVTNTSFTRPAQFVASQPNNKSFLRLRDFDDIIRWLRADFDAAAEWRDFPELVELAPKVSLTIPQ